MAEQNVDQKKQADEARKKLKEDRDAREKATRDAGQVKPTPTQEENDLAAMGVHVLDKEPDGSPEQDTPLQVKEGKPTPPKGSYQTRETTPHKP